MGVPTATYCLNIYFFANLGRWVRDVQVAMASKKRSLDDMISESSGWRSAVEEDDYNTRVLELPEDETEDGLDRRLAVEAHELGLDPLPMLKASTLDSLAASLSMTTIASESNKQSSMQSRMSQSTPPTSCNSSTRREISQPPAVRETYPIQSSEPSGHSADDKRNARNKELCEEWCQNSCFRQVRELVQFY